MIPFDCFVGIDWSGNKEKWQKGLKIAVARPGSRPPKLVSGPGPKERWSRTAAISWIGDLVEKERALIGLDFAFGYPACGIELSWEYAEQICSGDENFYGGKFFRAGDALHSHLLNSPWVVRSQPFVAHLRATEDAAAKTKGATPQSIFNAVGAAQVGPSSISGMRALLHVRQSFGSRVSIWPFDEIERDRSLIVEIFPRYFPRMHELSPKLSDHKALNAALAAFDSAPVMVPPASEDEGDALITAAALRSLSRINAFFNPPDISVRHQGWIFGVPLGGLA